MRLSKTGVEIEEVDPVVVLLVKTHAPNKYLLIDRETGQVYVGKNPGGSDKDISWLYIDDITRKDIRRLERYTQDID